MVVLFVGLQRWLRHLNITHDDLCNVQVALYWKPMRNPTTRRWLGRECFGRDDCPERETKTEPVLVYMQRMTIETY